MRDAGFAEVNYLGPAGFHTSEYTSGALFRVVKPV